jgi:hypothetical protein
MENYQCFLKSRVTAQPDNESKKIGYGTYGNNGINGKEHFCFFRLFHYFRMFRVYLHAFSSRPLVNIGKPISSPGSLSLRRKQSLYLPHHTFNLLLISQRDHEKFVSFIDADHTIGEKPDPI